MKRRRRLRVLIGGTCPNARVRNNQMVLRPTLIACLCLIHPCSTFAQDAAPADQDLLAKAMKASGLSYTDIGRFYQFKFNFSAEKREQYAFLRKRVDTYNSLSVQEAYSMVYESKTAPSTEIIQKVFQKALIIGGFIMEEPSENQEDWRIGLGLKFQQIQRLKGLRHIFQLWLPLLSRLKWNWKEWASCEDARNPCSIVRFNFCWAGLAGRSSGEGKACNGCHRT